METKTRAGWATVMVALAVLIGLGLLAWLIAVAVYPLFS
jgi:hypothetical protein